MSDIYIAIQGGRVISVGTDVNDELISSMPKEVHRQIFSKSQINKST